MFIPGLCRVWAKRISTEPQYWFKMAYAPRGYGDCESLVEYYEENWPNGYYYQITADSDICRPA